MIDKSRLIALATASIDQDIENGRAWFRQCPPEAALELMLILRGVSEDSDPVAQTAARLASLKLAEFTLEHMKSESPADRTPYEDGPLGVLATGMIARHLERMTGCVASLTVPKGAKGKAVDQSVEQLTDKINRCWAGKKATTQAEARATLARALQTLTDHLNGE